MILTLRIPATLGHLTPGDLLTFALAQHIIAGTVTDVAPDPDAALTHRLCTIELHPDIVLTTIRDLDTRLNVHSRDQGTVL
jgi:hypothetical protein